MVELPHLSVLPECPVHFDDAKKGQILSRIERLQALMTELEQVAVTALDRAKIRDRMKRELELAKQAVRRLGTHDSL